MAPRRALAQGRPLLSPVRSKTLASWHPEGLGNTARSLREGLPHPLRVLASLGWLWGEVSLEGRAGQAAHLRALPGCAQDSG